MIIVYLSLKKIKMRKLLPFIFFSSFGAFGQLVGGEMVASGRNIVTQTDFKLDGHNNGWAIYTLAVDLDGKVTSADFKRRFVSFIMTKSSITNNIYNNISFKFLSIFRCNSCTINNRFCIIAVNMEYWSLNHFGYFRWIR